MSTTTVRRGVPSFRTQVREWIRNASPKVNEPNVSQVDFLIGLSPQDPAELSCFYFNVTTEILVNDPQMGVYFSGKIYTCFKIKNENKPPSVEFLYELVSKAALDFQIISTQSNLVFPKPYPLAVAELRDMKTSLQKCIQDWEFAVKDQNLN